jgi:hypothetical protein
MTTQISDPSELFKHDTTCQCFQDFIEALPTTSCSDCKKLRSKLTNDSPNYFFKDIWCHAHSNEYCAVCQTVKPSSEDRIFGASEGYCINCWDSHKYGYSVPGLAEHKHHHYCSRPHSSCNYRKDNCCPYYNSAIRYPCNKKVIDDITMDCYKAVQSRLPKRR